MSVSKNYVQNIETCKEFNRKFSKKNCDSLLLVRYLTLDF